jgi:CheY-like chemotaxis protein
MIFNVYFESCCFFIFPPLTADGIEAVRRYRAMELQWSQKTIEDLLTDETGANESGGIAATVPPHDRQHHPSSFPTNEKEQENEDRGRDPRLFARSKSSDVLVAQKPLIIVGMSANSDSESKRLAQEAGMDYFLEKPFSMSDFNELLLRIHFSQHPDEFLSSVDDETLSILDSPPGVESPLTVLHRQESSSLRFVGSMTPTPALSPDFSPQARISLSPGGAAPKKSSAGASSSATINLVRKVKERARAEAS